MNSASEKLRSSLPWLAVTFASLLALRKIDDFDTWWHMAAGRWIVQNGSIPATDPLSFTVPGNEWINLQWLFDVGVYALHAVGGPNFLIAASVVSFSLTFAVLARLVSRSVDPTTAAILVAWGAAMSAERFVVRPEMATFALFALVWSLVSRARDNGGRYLPALVPIFVLWVNLHSLFILGLAVVVAHIVAAEMALRLPLPRGWAEDSRWEEPARRNLLRWGGSAVLATLLNPFGIQAWLLPLELFTRIDGSAREVFQVIGEFRPPWSGYFPTFSIGAYQAYFVMACAVVALAGILRAFPGRKDLQTEERGRFDLGAVAVFVALAWLSLLARRNVGVFAIGSLPVVAASLRVVADRSPQLLKRGFAAAGTGLNFIIPVTFIALSWLVVSNDWYASRNEQHEFGWGVFEENFPIYASDFFKTHNLPGPVYNDMTAGGYLTWAQLSDHGVYVDGRLEVYDPEFFGTYLRSLSDMRVFSSQLDQFGIQSVLLFHRWGNRDRLINALAQSDGWAMLYRDEVAIVFTKIAGNESAVASAQSAMKDANQATRARMAAPHSGLQRPLARTFGMIAYSRLLQNLGELDESLYVSKAMLALPLDPQHEVAGLSRAGALLAHRGDLSQARLMFERILALDSENRSAHSMLERIDAIAGS